MSMHGKWSEENVPHKGWVFESMEDLGRPSAICEMCEHQEIRYVHYLTHRDYPKTLGVGCVCASKMEEDYDAPKRREKEIRNEASRRARWLTRNWKESAKGNDYLNADGYIITVFQKKDGTWGASIKNKMTEEPEYSKRKCFTEDDAKLAAFDALLAIKKKEN